MKEPPPKPGYFLVPAVEVACVLAMCENPKFWAAVGHAIEPERLTDPVARQVAAAAHAVVKRFGVLNLSWVGAVVQHITDQMLSGKVTVEELEACKDYLVDAATNDKHVPFEELVAVVLPVIQKVKHREALEATLAGKVSSSQASEAFERVAKLGTVPVVQGSSIESIVHSPGFFSEDKRPRLLFGVPELDDAVGGLEQEALALFIGGSGAGKSMALIHTAVENFFSGRHVLYVTLELSPTRVAHRMVRNVTGMNKLEMQIDPVEAARRFDLIASSCKGKLVIAWAEPRVTSPRDIKRLVDEEMRRDPDFSPSVFVVDFVDKIRVNSKDSLYDDMIQTTDGLRSLAVEARGWTVTASQSIRRATSKPWLDLDDVADSMNKVRSADLVVAIGRSEEDKAQDLIRFCIPKRREGQGANARIGPIPWDPEHGRICVVNRRTPW